MSRLSDRFTTSEQTVKENLSVDNELKERLLDKVNANPFWAEYPPEKQLEMVKYVAGDNEPADLIQYVTGFGPIQHLLDNEKVSAVFINGVNSVHIEIDGKILNTEMKLSESMLNFVINACGNSEDNLYSVKIDNYFVTVIKPEICTSGTNITIRKIKDYDVDSLIQNGMLDKKMFDLLALMIAKKKRIVISGLVNSGKTTLLEVLVKSCLLDKRCYLLEKFAKISAQSDLLVKFCTNNYEELIEVLLKSSPEYIVADLNCADDRFLISTMRAASVNETVKNLISLYPDLPEKYAKVKALTEFDYIVYLRDNQIAALVELKPAKTMALSINTIFER